MGDLPRRQGNSSIELTPHFALNSTPLNDILRDSWELSLQMSYKDSAGRGAVLALKINCGTKHISNTFPLSPAHTSREALGIFWAESMARKQKFSMLWKLMQHQWKRSNEQKRKEKQNSEMQLWSCLIVESPLDKNRIRTLGSSMHLCSCMTGVMPSK